MATAGTHIEANGLKVYYEAYGEDEVLGQPSVSKEPGRVNSTVYGLGEREIVHRRSVADLSFSAQVREGPIRKGQGHPAPRGARQPDGTQPLLRDEKDLPGVLALFRVAYDLAADNAVDGSPQRNKVNDKPTRADAS